jgi:hypothetical protein
MMMSASRWLLGAHTWTETIEHLYPADSSNGLHREDYEHPAITFCESLLQPVAAVPMSAVHGEHAAAISCFRI